MIMALNKSLVSQMIPYYTVSQKKFPPFNCL